MKVYNTLSRRLEEFVPLNEKEVTLYTCGPTVYHYAHIGNLRAYLFADTLKRVLYANGYSVKHVMNITDVGHLVSDEDTGEDKMQKGARREGKTAWDVAKFYTDAFIKDLDRLTIQPPTFQPRATEYITEQIELVKKLEEKGYTYRTSQGVVYDTSKFPHYNKLSRMDLEKLKEGARVEEDREKKNPTDFYLWKFSPKTEKRDMEWNSPWGVGFPGWHIECSAMAITLLGETIDIHTGGPEHITIHHTNEIAQSEAATGKQFVRYWMHFNYITLANSEKMAKSGDNFLTLQRVIDMGFEPMVYRYFVLTAQYRSELEFSVESLQSAKQTLNSIRRYLYDHPEAEALQDTNSIYYTRFMEAMNNDLDTPAALAVMHEMLGSSLSDDDKRAHLLSFDALLGLRFSETIHLSEYLDPQNLRISVQDTVSVDDTTVSAEVLLSDRKKARDQKDWKRADEIRDTFKKAGYEIEDTAQGSKLKKI
jgi:cysteinyl-tRNA synthetase